MSESMKTILIKTEHTVRTDNEDSPSTAIDKAIKKFRQEYPNVTLGKVIADNGYDGNWVVRIETFSKDHNTSDDK